MDLASTEVTRMENIRASFMSWGWLLPALVPTAYTAGRSIGTVLYILYALWAILALRKSDFHIPKPMALLYLGLLVVFMLGTTEAIDIERALHGWRKFAFHSMVFFITWTVLRARPWRSWEAQAFRWLGWAAVAAAGIFMARMVPNIIEHGLAGAALVTNGLVAAYMLPFLMLFVSRHLTSKSRLWTGLIVALPVLALVANLSRTEMVVAGLVLASMLWIRSGWKVRITMSVLTAVVLAAGIHHISNHLDPVVTGEDGRPVSPFSRDLETMGERLGGIDIHWMATLDNITSHRSTFWFGALAYPPNNPLIGVGVRNVRYHRKLFITVKAKHMHNFLMDAWYETGLLGVAMLMAWLGFLIGGITRGVRRLGDTELAHFSIPLGASVVGVLAASSLDKTYHTVSFSMFMFFCLALLWSAAHQPKESSTPTKDEPETELERALSDVLQNTENHHP
ncbi:MAG: O-antigen ligase family protein [Magnetococcales bacterium]|nr:O-antigen ligase family protein [Magnetococcales bacterium]